jgi:pantoate--beta-alanine ligase
VEIVRTVAALRDAVQRARCAGSVIGLVPTMGALHEGHLSLIRRARAECGFVITTTFVNPTQFAPTEDLSRYPRPFEADCREAEEAGTNVIFAPPVEEVYPAGFVTHVAVEGLSVTLEGASRPTHFQGVTTVVAKLFNMAQADRSYFGQKDFQQLQVIRRMTRDLDFPIEIVCCPIVREPDGLAMSSRNVYLTPEQRRAAVSLSQGLRSAEAAFAAGERSGPRLLERVTTRLRKEPLIRPDYVEMVDAATLQAVESVVRPAALCVAAYLGTTRLIDNTLLEL